MFSKRFVIDTCRSGRLEPSVEGGQAVTQTVPPGDDLQIHVPPVSRPTLKARAPTSLKTLQTRAPVSLKPRAFFLKHPEI